MRSGAALKPGSTPGWLNPSVGFYVLDFFGVERMDLKTYQAAAHETAVYPADRALEYVALGLAGEAGEVSNKVKKLIRDGDDQGKREVIASELGDALWYIAELATVLGADLEDIAKCNIAKLNDRRFRGKLQGNGDNR